MKKKLSPNEYIRQRRQAIRGLWEKAISLSDSESIPRVPIFDILLYEFLSTNDGDKFYPESFRICKSILFRELLSDKIESCTHTKADSQENDSAQNVNPLLCTECIDEIALFTTELVRLDRPVVEGWKNQEDSPLGKQIHDDHLNLSVWAFISSSLFLDNDDTLKNIQPAEIEYLQNLQVELFPKKLP